VTETIKKFRFNTIFWKIFLSYWLVMIIIVSATFVAVALFADRDRMEMERRFSAQAKASALVTVYEHGGIKEARQWLHRRDRGKGGPVYFLNDEFNDLLGKTVPQRLQRALAEGGQVYFENDRPRVVQKVLGEGDQLYWIAGLVSPKHLHRGFRGERIAPFFPFRRLSGLLALLVTGVISYLLARHLTSPIRELQLAAQRMASGDLTARVVGKIDERRDELGELARDFNSMGDEIERLISAQKRMLRDVSHELRSPLARLQVALGLARKSAGEQCEKDHDRIEKEVVRLDELIGQVISLVRMETSRQELNKSKVALDILLNDVVEDARFEAGSKNKQVQLTLESTTEIQADPELLSSALENIVRNAVAYTPEDSSVDVQLASDNGQHVIKVLDQGDGVDESSIGSLFDAFYREGDARGRESGGYGLGLAIAQRAVLLHDGTIHARNHPEGGLEIEVRLPQ